MQRRRARRMKGEIDGRARSRRRVRELLLAINPPSSSSPSPSSSSYIFFSSSSSGFFLPPRISFALSAPSYNQVHFNGERPARGDLERRAETQPSIFSHVSADLSGLLQRKQDHRKDHLLAYTVKGVRARSYIHSCSRSCVRARARASVIYLRHGAFIAGKF